MVDIRNNAELLQYLKEFKNFLIHDQITSNYSVTYLKQINDELNELIEPVDEELADKHKKEYINLYSYGQALILNSYLDEFIKRIEEGKYE